METGFSASLESGVDIAIATPTAPTSRPREGLRSQPKRSRPRTLAELDEQLQAAKKAVEKIDLPEAASAAMKEVEERVSDLRRRLGVGRREPGPPPEDDVRGEITRLRGSLLGATAVPTEAQNRVLQKAATDLTKAVAT
jgi:hypothetical protein